MQFSQAARMRLFAISHNRNVSLSTTCTDLRDRLNVSAAVGIPKDGEYLFGGKLLESVDTDIAMHKRAKEVASRLAKPRRVDDIRRQRLRQFTSFSFRGPFVPAVEDSAAPHAAEEGPMVGDPPSGSLPPFRVVNYYSGDLRISDYSPVGGSGIPSLQILLFFP